jgi:hypothetical protein
VISDSTWNTPSEMVSSSDGAGAAAPGVAQRLQVEPVGGNQRHVDGQRVRLFRAGVERPGRAPACDSKRWCARCRTVDAALEACAQAGVGGAQFAQVAVHEAEVVDDLEAQVNQQPQVVGRRPSLPGLLPRILGQRRLIAGVQAHHDVFLVAEVVVEVARADTDFVGDVVRGDVGRARVR